MMAERTRILIGNQNATNLDFLFRPPQGVGASVNDIIIGRGPITEGGDVVDVYKGAVVSAYPSTGDVDYARAKLDCLENISAINDRTDITDPLAKHLDLEFFVKPSEQGEEKSLGTYRIYPSKGWNLSAIDRARLPHPALVLDRAAGVYKGVASIFLKPNSRLNNTLDGYIRSSALIDGIIDSNGMVTPRIREIGMTARQQAGFVRLDFHLPAATFASGPPITIRASFTLQMMITLMSELEFDSEMVEPLNLTLYDP